VDKTAIVVLAVIIALSLGIGGWLVLSPVEEPPPPGVIGDPGVDGPLPGTAPDILPEPPAPATEAPSEAGADGEDAPGAGKKPAPPARTEEAAIATMKATLEGTSFNLEVKELSIRAALDLLAKLTDVEINMNLADSAKLDQKISFSFASTPILDAIEFICQMRGLKYEVGPRGIVIK